MPGSWLEERRGLASLHFLRPLCSLDGTNRTGEVADLFGGGWLTDQRWAFSF